MGGAARPCLVLLGSPEELAARANDGIELVVMSCQSEGAIELFIEPVLFPPAPRGDRADPHGRHAHDPGRDAGVEDRGSSTTRATRRPTRRPGRVVTTLDLEAADVTEQSLVVVATQGQYDELP